MQQDQLLRLFQQVREQSPPPVGLVDAIAEYQKNVNTIGSSWLPRDMRNLAFDLNRAQLHERLKQFFL